MESLTLLRFLTDHGVVTQNLVTFGITPKKKNVPEIEEQIAMFSFIFFHNGSQTILLISWLKTHQYEKTLGKQFV